MNKSIIKKILAVILVLAAVSGSFVLGAYLDSKRIPQVNKIAQVFNKAKAEAGPIDADFEPFWKVWNIINEKYPNGHIADQDKVWGAISGLASSLNDPYTVFFPPQEAKLFKDQISGSFGGVGMEVGIKDKVLTVISPLKDSPAEKAGIKAGDKILKIDDTVTVDLSIDKAISLMRGEVGTKVKLTILHENDGDPKEITVTRDTIAIPVIDTKLRTDGIFVIQLYSFSENSATLFRQALRKFIDSGSKKLILDLRGNPGGYLDAAVDMASWFLPLGSTIVSEDFGSKADKQVYRSKGYDIFNKNLKMVMLVDAGSASASEILAGALSEHGIAKLIGEKTYGKGSVQELIDITPDTAFKITVAKWLTPNGISISEKGIEPDFKVALAKGSKPEDKDKDSQLDKAVEVINSL
jgi:carboxyl-terminal processing protease